MTRPIPAPAMAVVDAYARAVQMNLGNCVEAVYLYGSIALDAFVENASDIDFITIVNRSLTPSDIALLAEIHKGIEHKFPAPQMMGSYLQWHDLGKTETEIKPYPYFYEHRMHDAGHCDINPVTWWILKKSGVAVIGPDSQELRFQVNVDDLIAYVHRNMNSYWAGWIERLENSKPILLQDANLTDAAIDERIEWTVLGMLRQYFTLNEQEITSKIGAGHYGLTKLPERWHPLIQEAIQIRLGNSQRYYESRQQRITEGIELLKWIRAECNSIMSGS